MKVLIIEDEELAAERLEKLLKEVLPEIDVMAKIGSVKESVKWLMVNNADLIFLDIQLSDGLSFTIFDQISIQTPVIFTTAYDQYAIKAFDLNSVSYLLKPIMKRDLSESLRKYKSLRTAFGIDFENMLSVIQGRKPEYRQRFLVQVGEKFRKVEAANISYFYALEKNVFLMTSDGISYPVDMSLENLSEVIDPNHFFRINRKYIVNLSSIVNMYAWSRSRIKLILKPSPDNEMDTIVSIDRASDFKKWMNK